MSPQRKGNPAQAASRGPWPAACDEERARSENRKEHVMMFAFALALVGVVVLGSLNVIAAHAR
jgi:hypothetical protein